MRHHYLPRLFPILSLLALFLTSSCGLFRAAVFIRPNTDDYRHNPQRLIAPPAEPFQFIRSNQTEDLGQHLHVYYHFVQDLIPLDDFVKLYNTQAFLIIRNDTILYERYPNGYAARDVVTTFSISKAIMTTLTGIAIRKGELRSIDQPVCEILPEWAERGFGDLTIRHLLQHTSGMSFSFSTTNLNSDLVQFYYGKNLRRRMAGRKVVNPPGERFDYHSANTQLLGLVLERATGQTLSQYLETNLWKPLGMETSATWSLDRKDEKGVEKAFCCLQAQPIDFAKLGRLWLCDGEWNGQQLLPTGWMKQMLESPWPEYHHYTCGFTITGEGSHKAFFASGLLGQFIYVVPEKNLMILRFGEHRKDYMANIWTDVLEQLAIDL